MKYLLFVFLLALCASCNQNPKEEERYISESVAKDIITKQIENNKQKSVENQVLIKQIARSNMLKFIKFEGEPTFESNGNFLANNTLENISCTVVNISSFDISDLEIQFNYVGCDKKTVLGNYISKVGTLESGQNKLLNAPSKEGCSVECSVIKYNCSDIDMCFDIDRDNTKSYLCNEHTYD